MVKVTVANDSSVVYLDPCTPYGELHQKLAPFGVFHEFTNSSLATVPLSTRFAQALREVLRGRTVELEPSHGSALAAVADGSPKEAVSLFLSQNRKFAILNEPLLSQTEFSTWSSFKRQEPGIKEIADGYFRVALDDLPKIVEALPSMTVGADLRALVPTSGPALFGAAPSASAPRQAPPVGASGQSSATTPESDRGSVPAPTPAATEVFTEIPALNPFPSYDGTFASLRNVELAEYTYIQQDLERNKKTPKKAIIKGLQKMGLHTAFDLLHYYPFRYIDRSNPELVSRIQEGTEGTVIGTVTGITPNYGGGPGTRTTPYVEVYVKDVMGDVVGARFFRQMYLTHQIKKGDQVIFQGLLQRFGRKLSFNKAQIEKVNSDGITLQVIPVYHQSEANKVKTAQILRLIQETISRVKSFPVPEFLPDQVREAYRVPSRMDAYQAIHLPSNAEEAHNARRRLEYEELLRLQLFIQRRKKSHAERAGTRFPDRPYPMTTEYISSLPYPLTGAQERALREVFEKVGKPVPMNCLIQGDVGAGKSTVANATAIRAVEAGYQVALMAPTEILAEQLHEGIVGSMSSLFSPRTGQLMNIRFLGGKTTAKNKRIIDEELKDGSVDVVVGTSSLLFGREFQNLGMVIIDEQHRFGVEQREALKHVRTDGLTPHLLSMSATPIPRSSAMVVYGDMDIVVLDELPPGRIPIKTEWVPVNAQESVGNPDEEHWHKIREQVQMGHQAYVVASLVEDNEDLAAQSVEDAYDVLSRGIFPDLRVAMVHGKQNRKDRTEIMNAFSAGEIDILVSTTVIEVGVNVPNSTVMVILDPGRFGIAQLHQIRGRVGRASFPSVCYLVGEAKTDVGISRLSALVESTDGFYLAEKDLELRGEGTLFGNSQSGESDLRLASLQRSLPTLKVARSDAEKLLDGNPDGFDIKVLMDELEVFMNQKEIKS